MNAGDVFVTPSVGRSTPRLIEETGLTIILGAMILLPVVEIALRIFGRSGIAASSAIVQHCTLLVSMAGAALASRDGRLLSMGASGFLPKTVARNAAAFAQAGGAAIAAILCAASARFVATEYASGRVLAWGIPVWIVESALPIGFAAIALRLITRASERWLMRATIAAVALLAAFGALTIEQTPHSIVIAGAVGIALIAIAGAPIFAVIGGAAVVAYVATQIPISSLTVSHYALVVNPSLPAIPLFTLAGYILAEGVRRAGW